MKKTLLIAFVLLFSSLALAVPVASDSLLDSLTLAICKAAPNKESIPDAKYAVLSTEKHIILAPDGGYTIEWHSIYKILTSSGKKELSNIKYRYDSDYEKIDIQRARSITIQNDSSFAIVVVDSLQINEITVPGLSDAGIYASLKQKVVTIPGVVDSSIVEISGRTVTYAKPKKPFEGNEILASENPINDFKLIIEVPAGMKLIYHSANGAPEPIIEDNTYTWILKDYKGLVPESGGPLRRDFLPTVFYTVTKSWNLAGDYVQSKFSPKILVTEDITAKANAICGELIGKEAIDTIASWVANNIRTVALSLGDAGYSPNDASTVLKNSYGDSRDRAVLLAALLKARGFANPNIALLPQVNAKVHENVFSLAQFDKVVVTIIQDGEKLWLSTDDDYTLPDHLTAYDGEKALVVSQGKGELVELPKVEAKSNGMAQHWEIALTPDGGISGSLHAILRGDYERGIRDEIRDEKPKKRKQKMEGVASNIGGGKLLSDTSFSFLNLEDLKNRPEMTLRFVSDSFAFMQGDMMIFNFPNNPLEFAGTAIQTSLDERKEPLVLDAPFAVEYMFKVKIPDGFKVAWVSEPKSVTNDFGEMTVVSSVNGNEVEYSIALTVKDCWVEPNEYSKAVALMRAYQAPKNRMILLEKIPPPTKPVEDPKEGGK